MSLLFIDLDLFVICGLIGFTSHFVPFCLLQFGKIDGNGPTYVWLNVVGAVFVLVSLYDAFNLASALTQVCWVFIGSIGLMRRAQLKARASRACSLSR